MLFYIILIVDLRPFQEVLHDKLLWLNSSTVVQAIVVHFWLALPTRLPMFLIPGLPDTYHAAPRWKGHE